MIAIGLMSGTSLDGIDAALVEILPRGSSYGVALLAFMTLPFEPELLDRLRGALPPNAGSAAAIALLHRRLGKAFAEAARAVAGRTQPDYVASHGQTIFHDGSQGLTLQLGDAFAIRDALRATVCFDFRSADCAAGGQGAPLMPYVDHLLLASQSEDRVAVNIGGIANLTVLERDAGPERLVAFDSGPGNMLLDLFVHERTKGQSGFDRGGKLALAGTLHERALAAMRADPYFSLAPPKTTGRERFGTAFLQAHARDLDQLSLPDGAATLAALTAASIADAVRQWAPRGARVICSGGGARNEAIVQGLRKLLDGFSVERSDSMNLDADAKEAMGFAVLGYETLRGRAAGVPAATGAHSAAVLGALAPFDLVSLLRKVESECRA